jgi:hypothetical protein
LHGAAPREAAGGEKWRGGRLGGGRRRGRHRRAAGCIVHLAAQHFADEREARELGSGKFADELAVAQDGNAVADRVNLIEKMRDEHDAEAVGAQAAHHGEEFRDLFFVETGRRFVEHEQARAKVESAGDGDHLLHRDGERTELGVDVTGNLQARERLTGVATDGAPVDETEAARLPP